MKAVTFYFRNLEPTQSLQRFVLPFLTFMVDVTFGKILNIWEQSKGSISTNAQVNALQKMQSKTLR